MKHLNSVTLVLDISFKINSFFRLRGHSQFTSKFFYKFLTTYLSAFVYNFYAIHIYKFSRFLTTHPHCIENVSCEYPLTYKRFVKYVVPERAKVADIFDIDYFCCRIYYHCRIGNIQSLISEFVHKLRLQIFGLF